MVPERLDHRRPDESEIAERMFILTWNPGIPFQPGKRFHDRYG